MAIFRRVVRYVKNLFICHPLSCGLIVLIICGTYSIWTKYTFLNNNDKFYHTKIIDKKVKTNGQNNQIKPKVEFSSNMKGRKIDKGSDFAEQTEEINILITFTQANHDLQLKFRVTLESMLRFSSSPITLHILGDNQSQAIASKIVDDIVQRSKKKCKVVKLDIDVFAKQLHDIVKEMQKHFSFKPGSYFSDPLFFLSIAIHRVMPSSMHKVIMLDSDLKFNADISHLYQLFTNFSSENVIGIARENQPVYRHTFQMYRSKNPGTRVGGAPPNGLTGFNSGVLLLNLDRMRESSLYNNLIDSDSVGNLSAKYMFKGHLGDQDFFTLLSLEHENLFYVLPCTWNRQLCIWWKDKGYESVFDMYFQCKGHINIYHGNCNTQIPKLDWEDSKKF